MLQASYETYLSPIQHHRRVTESQAASQWKYASLLPAAPDTSVYFLPVGVQL